MIHAWKKRWEITSFGVYGAWDHEKGLVCAEGCLKRFQGWSKAIEGSTHPERRLRMAEVQKGLKISEQSQEEFEL